MNCTFMYLCFISNKRKKTYIIFESPNIDVCENQRNLKKKKNQKHIMKL